MTGVRVGPAPYGYKREDGQFVLDPIEAPIRLRIFELFVEHERVQIVANALYDDGHRTRADALFTSPTIKRLLVDKKVLGVPGEFEQLIPEELWKRCDAILQSHKGKGGPARKVVNLFSGFVHCSCGQKMYVPSNTKKYVCSDCNTKITSDDLEEVFRSQLQTYPLPHNLRSEDTSLFDRWVTFTFENKRRLVEAITKRIEVSDEKKITCFFFFV